MLEIGMINEASVSVTDENTAISAKSGSLPVFATPFMVALMEQAASELCEKHLDDALTTVGTSVSISHLAATATGVNVRAIATITDYDGRKITFDVEAYDNAGLIGKGTHERFTVKKDKFTAKALERKNLSEN